MKEKEKGKKRKKDHAVIISIAFVATRHYYALQGEK